MGSCTRRHFMLSTCLLQMITIIERQVFDFLGYMWAPIVVNLFHIIFILLGFYGAYHFRIKYIITYLIWNFIWIGWNAFLICFYLNVGTLDRDGDLLNFGTGSFSWFEVNGYGCKPTYPVNITSDDPFRPIRPERVDDCLLDYTVVEVIQSGVQCVLALLGILGAILISYIFLDEDDRFDFVNGDAKSPQHTVVHPMYVSYSSIPTSASASATLLSQKHQSQPQHQIHINHATALNSNSNNSNNSNSNSTTNHHLHQHQQQQQQLQLQTQLQPYNNNNNINHNTFLIHSTNNNNNNHGHGHSHVRSHGRSGSGGSGSHRKSGLTPGASKNNTLTRMLYSPKNSNKIASSSTSIVPLAGASGELLLQRQQSLPPHGPMAQLYYDDSTAKADQLYTNSNRRQLVTYQLQQQQLPAPGTPNSSTHDNTTSSLSYASLQNSNMNLTQSVRGGSISGGGYSGGYGVVAGSGNSGGGGSGVGAGTFSVGGESSLATLSPLSNSQFSLTNSMNNNNNYSNANMQSYSNGVHNNNNAMNNNNNSVNGHFARIHAKPKPPKSTSYSSFINGSAPSTGSMSTASNGGGAGGSLNNVHRPDIKYTQMANERLSRNLEEGFEDDNFSLQNFKTDDGITYVPFQKPTPAALFVGQNNNPSYASLNSYTGVEDTQSSLTSPNNNASPHNNNNNINGIVHAPQYARSVSQLQSLPPPQFDNREILLEHGAVLQPAYHHSQHQPRPPALNPANRFLYQQNGLQFHPAYPPAPATHVAMPAASPSPSPSLHAPHKTYTRPTNIPLPTIPAHSFDTPISPSEVTPPPPPQPRPHIFTPRSGHAPYPDLSPEVTEKYAMPTQYVPRSPVASRIARRQRQQHQQHHNHQKESQPQPTTHNTSVNFVDQIRDAPPGYIDNGFGIVRAKSYDRLTSSSASGSARRAAKEQSPSQAQAEAAPHVNRRSGRRDANGKARPRSYCNSMSGVRHVKKKSKHRQSLYSIEFGPSIDTLRSRTDTILDYDDHLHARADGGELSPKPMTPRRVKRRSVMARGSNNRLSTTSRRSHHGGSSRSLNGADGGSSHSSTGTHPRNSTRSSRRKYQQNPVTKLLDQQQQQLQQQQQHHHHGGTHSKQPVQQFGSFHQHKSSTAALTASNLQTLNQEIINGSSATNNIVVATATASVVAGSLTKSNNNNYHSFRKNIPPDPIYYNTNAQTGLFHQAWQSNSQSPIVAAVGNGVDEPPPTPTLTPTPLVSGGHYNPTYQHSTTNLNDGEHIDEMYNNRPPSVRSSYSNFHGTRPLSSYLSNAAGATENVFVGLSGAAQQQTQTQSQSQSQPPPPMPPLPPHVAPSTPPLYQTHPLHQQQTHSSSQQHIPSLPSPNYSSSPPQNIPFGKRTASRESIRSMAFLNSGPPAYNLNYHTPPDSETTM